MSQLGSCRECVHFFGSIDDGGFSVRRWISSLVRSAESGRRWASTFRFPVHTTLCGPDSPEIGLVRPSSAQFGRKLVECWPILFCPRWPDWANRPKMARVWQLMAKLVRRRCAFGQSSPASSNIWPSTNWPKLGWLSHGSMGSPQSMGSPMEGFNNKGTRGARR